MSLRLPPAHTSAHICLIGASRRGPTSLDGDPKKNSDNQSFTETLADVGGRRSISVDARITPAAGAPFLLEKCEELKAPTRSADGARLSPQLRQLDRGETRHCAPTPQATVIRVDPADLTPVANELGCRGLPPSRKLRQGDGRPRGLPTSEQAPRSNANRRRWSRRYRAPADCWLPCVLCRAPGQT